METILLTLVSEPKMVFLSSLISVLATFNNGMINSCGCLLLMLCNTSKGMIHVGNCLSKLISNMLLVFKFHGVHIEIHVIDLLCNVHCPLVFANCPGTGGTILSARNCFFMVIHAYLLNSKCNQFYNFAAKVIQELYHTVGCSE